MYKLLVRPFLFLFQAETAHRLTFALLKIFSGLPFSKGLLRLFLGLRNIDQRPVSLFGLSFPNRVGLAAGFDKNADLVDVWEWLGFGFIEIGTVTPRPQTGNPKPRIFRLPEDHALINRLGFNNDGLDKIASRLKGKSTKIPVGGNIGKNKTTTNEDAQSDYLSCLQVLHPFVDFFTVNVSSPNTPDLRSLQEKEPLRQLLSVLVEEANRLGRKPILLKIAPDLSFSQIDDILEIIAACKLDGIVVSNTTISREGLVTPGGRLEEIGAGGLSGRPVFGRSTEIIDYISQKSGGTLPIIGVGGIMSVDDALAKLKAGASLVQVYTGFIYEGPRLVQNIQREILRQNL